MFDPRFDHCSWKSFISSAASLHPQASQPHNGLQRCRINRSPTQCQVAIDCEVWVSTSTVTLHVKSTSEPSQGGHGQLKLNNSSFEQTPNDTGHLMHGHLWSLPTVGTHENAGWLFLLLLRVASMWSLPHSQSPMPGKYLRLQLDAVTPLNLNAVGHSNSRNYTLRGPKKGQFNKPVECRPLSWDV